LRVARGQRHSRHQRERPLRPVLKIERLHCAGRRLALGHGLEIHGRRFQEFEHRGIVAVHDRLRQRRQIGAAAREHA
jgi:hypothetical protein